jgi:ATP-binding cassette subfamily F protein uup
MISELSALNERNSQGRTAEIEFSATDRVANKLLSVEEISKGFGGRPLFSGLSFILAPGTRMGLIGGNGSGKTTLLRILTGELAPDSGTVRRASRLRVVWFDQARQQLDKTLTLRQALCAQGDSVIYRGNSVHVVAWAKRFLFRTEQLDMQLSKLSGGEQARTLIANLMLQPADLLLLDEPTNDLDIATLEVLEDSLSDFPGAIVLITHDRYLLSRLSTEVLGLDGHGGARVFGDLEQWEAARQAANAAASSKEAPAKSTRAAAPAARPARLSYKESRELEGMQARITAAEAALAACHQEVERAAASGDYKQLHACSDALQAAQSTVDELYQRWEELESKAS